MSSDNKWVKELISLCDTNEGIKTAVKKISDFSFAEDAAFLAVLVYSNLSKSAKSKFIETLAKDARMEKYLNLVGSK